MKILIVHNRYRSAAPSGENRVVDQESQALRLAGHEVEQFERHSDEISDWSPVGKATLPARVVWNRRSHDDLADVLRVFEPDVVHVHNTFPLLSPSVLYACRDAQVPVVATIHNYKLLCASGDFFREGSVCHSCADGSLLPALRHRCYRGSALATLPVVVGLRAHRAAWQTMVSAYICISASLRQLLEGMHLDPARVFVKHNLVPLDADRPLEAGRAVGSEAAGDRPRYVAYVGRLDEAKGVPFLLRAWDHYRQSAGDNAMRLVIAGSGPLDAMVAQWAATRPSVEAVGNLTKSECIALIRRSGAVLLPSQWEETFGLVVVEAMAAGVPPIASAHGSFPELITDRVNGALFRAGSAEDLAALVHDVHVNPGRYEEYGRSARETYERDHDPIRNVGQLVEIYRFALGKPAMP